MRFPSPDAFTIPERLSDTISSATLYESTSLGTLILVNTWMRLSCSDSTTIVAEQASEWYSESASVRALHRACNESADPPTL